METQENLSIKLIFGVLFITAVYFLCVPLTDDEHFLHKTLISPIITVLSGAYVFVYRKSRPVISRAIFIFSIFSSAFSIYLYIFAAEMGRAFQH